MSSSPLYSLALVAIFLSASLSLVLTDAGPEQAKCDLASNCTSCVETKINMTVGNNETHCVWLVTRGGQSCSATYQISEDTISIIPKDEGCKQLPTPTPPASTTTQAPATTNATTVAPVTNATTLAPVTNATTLAPVTNATTLAPVTNATTLAPVTNATTLAPVTNATTTSVPSTTPHPSPSTGGFSWGSFTGGIIFAAALSSVAFLIFKFYKNRMSDRYHTFSNPTF